MKTYIEAGACDGEFQSRSRQYVNDPEYRGILIEASPTQYNICVQKRKNDRTHVINKCLVPFDYPDKTVPFNISSIHQAMNSVKKHSTLPYSNTIDVSASTLQDILDELSITHIDIFFLDVEGFELPVLKGIDFSRTTFSEIEIELHSDMLGITRDDEIKMHTEFLDQHGYKLTRHVNDAQPKIIFTK